MGILARFGGAARVDFFVPDTILLPAVGWSMRIGPGDEFRDDAAEDAVETAPLALCVLRNE